MASLSVSSSLYCAEDTKDIASWDIASGEDTTDDWTSFVGSSVGHKPIHDLLAAEIEHMPPSHYCSRFLSSSPDATARQDSINWILKVINFYRFSPVTAYLSVNYLDRFLSSNSVLKVAETYGGKNKIAGGWPMQLLSVACLSIAAKMEETHVPQLLDLQILDPKFVFEPKTIRRMELFVMEALRWRMRTVTPFDFLPHFAATTFPIEGYGRRTLLSRAAYIITCTHRVADFLRFRASVLAATALICSFAEIAGPSADAITDCPMHNYDLLCVVKDEIGACQQLMSTYLLDTCPSARGPTETFPSEQTAPQSPVAVLDAAACGSCDAQKTSGVVLPANLLPAKRRRIHVSQCRDRLICRLLS
ncbi:hypothetical protein HPP92_007766 [Vanilla planifolia]|uniref:Uncharacterized protein n=1 Tax=Vanilla planifolia TaxID=51239 RepID=A0A835RIT3_VANPL|nr:hypothetical protein HPP92_007766 [Vanilla planifolia]